eukprot:CAMPEP_0184697044 /NCGR_PEP_ID=MMETSP0313-20130426/4155_1 /TAXON_ID=2792 /ORGANISM="Porphyridium aerugineum, Strain SAG 1380-2" /LENGTH=577 /DNA_ID=CAMNT_0027155805 /DNA_START=244 /DNA_END=1977 /DNA_ORIENTATION=-
MPDEQPSSSSHQSVAVSAASAELAESAADPALVVHSPPYSSAPPPAMLTKDTVNYSDIIKAACRNYFSRVRETIKTRFKAWISNLLLMGLSYGVLYVLLGDDVLPGSPLFALLVCWAFAVVLGVVFDVIGLPSLLGQLIAGIVLRNLPGDILKGMKSSWMGVIRAFSMSLVMTRSGFSVNFKALYDYKWVGIRAGILPVIAVGIFVGCMAVPLLDLPWALGIALGFILASSAPAIVVTETLGIEEKYNVGKHKAVSTLVAVIAIFNMVAVISGYNISSAIAFQDGSLVWSILFGPVNTVVGILSGIIGIVLWFPNLVPNNKYLIAFFFVLNMGIVIVFQHFQWSGGAMLYAITMAIVARVGWERACIKPFMNKRFPSIASWSLFDVWPVPDALASAKLIALFLWEYVIAPALFSSIGTILNFSEGDSQVYGKAVVLILASWLVCIVFAFTTLFNSGLTTWEKLYVASILPAKATVQATLGGLPLAYFEANGTDQQKEWGKEIQITAAMAILIGTPTAVILARTLGPRWLSGDPREYEESTDDITDLVVIESPDGACSEQEINGKEVEGDDGVLDEKV